MRQGCAAILPSKDKDELCPRCRRSQSESSPSSGPVVCYYVPKVSLNVVQPSPGRFSDYPPLATSKLTPPEPGGSSLVGHSVSPHPAFNPSTAPATLSAFSTKCSSLADDVRKAVSVCVNQYSLCLFNVDTLQRMFCRLRFLAQTRI